MSWTKTELKTILKESIKAKNIKIKDKEVEKYILQMFKDKDPIEDILEYMTSSDVEYEDDESEDNVISIQGELEALED
jgi:hypothetical protein